MKLLVTGISGFIGGHVWAELARREDVWGVYGATGSVPLKPEFQLGVDLSNPESISNLVEDLKPTHIIHLAGLARPEIRRRESLLAWKVNHAATRELAATAGKLGARVIYASSDQVFDGTRGNYREGDPLEPVNIYGETKKAAERAILTLVDDSVILRLNNTYGPPRFRGGSFSEWILERERSSQPITLFVDQFRSPLDIVTAVRAILELIDHPFQGVLHLGGANRVNRVTFGNMLLKHLGRDQSSILEMQSAKMDPEGRMPLDTSFDLTLARQVLKTPIPNLMDGLKLAYGHPRSGSILG